MLFTSLYFSDPSGSFCRTDRDARHNTETALLKVMNNILRALDDGNIFVWTLLDLSAAFDTTDDKILLDRLENLYGISDTTLSWFESYLTGRTQIVTIDNNSSKPSDLCFGVLQGSVLGPVLFILYTKPLSNLIKHYSISNLSADDTQLLDPCHPDHFNTTVQRMQNCISEVKVWMDCNKLKINNEKLNLFWSSQTGLCSLILHPLLFQLITLTFHSLLMQEIAGWQSHLTQPWTSMSWASADPPTLSLPWISRHKLHLPPSDSQCNQNSPLCLCSLKVKTTATPSSVVHLNSLWTSFTEYRILQQD